MLILSRKIDERIKIGSDIYVTAVRIAGDKVRLGIEAPSDTPVHREEVALAIAAQATKNALTAGAENSTLAAD